MMKKLLSIFLSVSCFWTFAQEVGVTSTEEYTNALPNSYWTRVLGHDESGYYLLREFGPIGGNKTVVLEKYSPTLKPIFATNIEATTGILNNAKYHKYTAWKNGKAYVFLDGWNKANLESSFYVQEVEEDGSLAKHSIKLEAEAASSQSKMPYYKISFSPDGSKLAVLTEKVYEKGAKEKIRLQVFKTTDFSSLWQEDYTLDNTAERDPGNMLVVNNDGQTYLFKEIRIARKSSRFEVVTAAKGLFQVSEIDLKGYAATQKQLLIDAQGNLTITGMLGPMDQKLTDWQAFWHTAVGRSGEIMQHKVTPLGESLLRALVTGRQAAKEDYILENYVLKDVLARPSGGVLLLAEAQNHRSIVVTGQGLPMLSEEHDLDYGVAVIISIDAEGNREWNVVLDKSQKELKLDPKLGFGSYAYQLKGDNLYLVWNFMELRRDPPPLPMFRYWVDINRKKINVDNLFGKNAIYPTMLTAIDREGRFLYDQRTFKSLPLDAIQKTNAFPMAADPRIFFPTEMGMVILSHMYGMDAQRYKFSTIRYEE